MPNQITFGCPHCGDSLHEDAIEDTRFLKPLYRIQNSDDLNADPKNTIDRHVDLWYCPWCGKYFRAYYRLEKISLLHEEE